MPGRRAPGGFLRPFLLAAALGAGASACAAPTAGPRPDAAVPPLNDPVRAPSADEVAAAPEPPGTCSFTLAPVDPGGAAVPDVVVTSHEVGSAGPGPAIERNFAPREDPTAWQCKSTDPEGRVTFRGLLPGEHTLWTVLPGHDPALLAIVRLPMSGVPRVVFSAQTLVEGTVTEIGSGTPVPSAEVEVIVEAYVYWLPVSGRTTTDARGRWALRTYSDRRIESLRVTAPGWELVGDPSARPPAWIGRGRHGRMDVRMRRLPGPVPEPSSTRAAVPGPDTPAIRVRGRVVGPAEHPVPHARVQARTDGGEEWVDEFAIARSAGERWLRPPSSETAADGTFDLLVSLTSALGRVGVSQEPVRPRTVTVRAVAPGFASVESGALAVGHEPDGVTVDLRLHAGRTVAGRVLDARTRAPIAGAAVLLDAPSMRWESSAPGYPSPIHAATDAAGEFRIEHVRDAWTRVEVLAPGFLPGAATAGAAPVVVRLEPSRIVRGRAVYADGTPAVAVEVTLAAADGGDDDSDGICGPTDADGRFVFDSVPDAPVRLVFRDRGISASPRFVHHVAGRFSGRGGGEFVVTIPLPPRIRGRVVDAFGEPVAGARVVVSARGDVAAFTVGETDAEGEFDLPGPFEGAVTLRAQCASGEISEAVMARAGATGVVLTILVREGR